MTAVRVELLGPLRLVVDGAPVDVRGPKRRAVLALLAAAEGRVVTADHLLDALWPAEPPESGRAALQSHISRLRRHLGGDAPRLAAVGGGYRLALDRGELDVAQARALLRRAREAADPAAAADALHAANALWRGPVLAEFAEVPPLVTTAVAYEQLHRDVTPALGELERAVAAGKLTVATRPTRPVPARQRGTTRLLGREAQVAALERLLETERLVTVVGPGGVGKTCVALELARGAGAAVLRLAPVTDPAAVPHALAAALDLQVVSGDVIGACIALLGTAPALLVVDNCEHLLDAVRATVEQLLDGCPDLTVLATSREPLGLPGETPSRLAPLPLPGPDSGTTAQVPSVALFLDRAARAAPASSPTPGSCGWWPTSCAGSTGCHSQSSWPPAGSPGWHCPTSPPASTAPSTCSAPRRTVGRRAAPSHRPNRGARDRPRGPEPPPRPAPVSVEPPC
jgi:DNA-binding winged helix-turn-helix (wHTH) protein